MPTTAADLRRVALELFAADGYVSTSLQQIADHAGVSKATVLYHFASKEVLLESVLAPAVDQLGAILSEAKLAQLKGGGEERSIFLAQFVDFLLEHRAAAVVFVNQASSLVDVPIVARANIEIELVSGYLEASAGSIEEKVRFGIALGGAAYLLAGAPMMMPEQDIAVLRTAMITVLSDLLGVAPSLAAASVITSTTAAD